MGQVVLPGQPAVEIALRRSARSRRISLRVSRLDGRVTMSLPSWTSEAEAIRFAREKEGWIRSNLATSSQPVLPQIGGTVLFEGAELPIVAGSVRSARVEGGALIVPDQPDRCSQRVRAFLKLAARDRLSRASDAYAAALGQSYGRISLRDTRSRWGSCTTDRNLMYSWRLVMAPRPVLDYVAAHEVAHLVEMNHSPAYWRVVDSVYPDYAAPRKWLRDNGHRLHAYRFDN